MAYLLDNDVFFAALNAAHERHRRCRAWLDRAKQRGWAIAVETELAALRLLMNPAVMVQSPLTADLAFALLDAETTGPHPVRRIYATSRPAQGIVGKATGHKQVMDFWLVQLAMQNKLKLATMDAGTLAHWPEVAHRVAG